MLRKVVPIIIIFLVLGLFVIDPFLPSAERDGNQMTFNGQQYQLTDPPMACVQAKKVAYLRSFFPWRDVRAVEGDTDKSYLYIPGSLEFCGVYVRDDVTIRDPKIDGVIVMKKHEASYSDRADFVEFAEKLNAWLENGDREVVNPDDRYAYVSMTVDPGVPMFVCHDGIHAGDYIGAIVENEGAHYFLDYAQISGKLRNGTDSKDGISWDCVRISQDYDALLNEFCS